MAPPRGRGASLPLKANAGRAPWTQLLPLLRLCALKLAHWTVLNQRRGVTESEETGYSAAGVTPAKRKARWVQVIQAPVPLRRRQQCC
jgi:hypothetical protein